MDRQQPRVHGGVVLMRSRFRNGRAEGGMGHRVRERRARRSSAAAAKTGNGHARQNYHHHKSACHAQRAEYMPALYSHE
eukprot:6211199-Pleurochrysis_carterae.AAC.6